MKNLKRTIAIICGGDSSEYGVSLRSGQGLYSFFDKERYNVYIVMVRGLDWHVNLPDGTTTPIDRNDFSFMENGNSYNSITLTSRYTVHQAKTEYCKAILNSYIYPIPQVECL